MNTQNIIQIGALILGLLEQYRTLVADAKAVASAEDQAALDVELNKLEAQRIASFISADAALEAAERR